MSLCENAESLRVVASARHKFCKMSAALAAEALIFAVFTQALKAERKFKTDISGRGIQDFTRALSRA
jgi:hypothetical protein